MTQPESRTDGLLQVATADPVVAAVRRHAFTALLDDQPMTGAQLADATALPRAEVERALATRCTLRSCDIGKAPKSMLVEVSTGQWGSRQ